MGVAISFVMLIRGTAAPHSCVLGRLNGDWRDIKRFPQARVCGGTRRVDVVYPQKPSELYRSVSQAAAFLYCVCLPTLKSVCHMCLTAFSAI